jgi:hypothetical protein
MSNPQVAEQFSIFIQAVGFPKSRIRCQLKAQMRQGVPDQNEQVAYWANLLAINPEQITLIAPIRKRGPENGTLSIMLSYKVDATTDIASYGFRYALYMMGILMLASKEIVISAVGL